MHRSTWLNEWNTLVINIFYAIDPKFNTIFLLRLVVIAHSAWALFLHRGLKKHCRTRVDCIQWTTRTDCCLQMDQLRSRNNRFEALDLREKNYRSFRGIYGIYPTLQKPKDHNMQCNRLGLGTYSDFHRSTDHVQNLPRQTLISRMNSR